MAKVNTKLVVKVLASLSVLSGGSVWVNCILIPSSAPAQAQIPYYSQLGSRYLLKKRGHNARTVG